MCMQVNVSWVHVEQDNLLECECLWQLLCLLSAELTDLLHRHADDWMVAALRLAINDLLICKDSAKSFTPVYRHFSLICQIFVEQLNEDPLCPPTSSADCDPRAM